MFELVLKVIIKVKIKNNYLLLLKIPLIQICIVISTNSLSANTANRTVIEAANIDVDLL